MKKIIILLFAVFSLYANEASDAAKALGYLNSYKDAIALAKKEHKPVMMVVVRDRCPWCKKFERRTLKQERIKAKLQNYVKLLVDKKDEFPAYFQTPLVPVTYFIDPDTQNSFWEVIAYRDLDEFSQDIDDANDEYKNLKK